MVPHLNALSVYGVFCQLDMIVYALCGRCRLIVALLFLYISKVLNSTCSNLLTNNYLILCASLKNNSKIARNRLDCQTSGLVAAEPYRFSCGWSRKLYHLTKNTVIPRLARVIGKCANRNSRKSRIRHSFLELFSGLTT